MRAACLALALALCALAGPASLAVGATGAAGMAQDAFDSLTKSPSARQNTPKSAGTGVVSAPAQPKAPTVPATPGAAPQGPDWPARDTAPWPGQGAPQRTGQGADPQRKPPQNHRLTLTHDGQERSAVVLPPRHATGDKTRPQKPAKPPTLIFLHGAGGSATQAMRQTGLAERAPAAGLLTVFPEGLGPADAPGEGQTWNTWMCCGHARDQRVDDVGFLARLIERLRADYGADPERIFLAGFSNGAMLAARFALERPGVAAAIATISGILPCDAPRPDKPLPVLIIHGSRDNVARVAPTPAHPATGRFCEDHPARAQVDFWVRGMNLRPAPQVRDGGKSPLRVEDYVDHSGGRVLVRSVLVKGGGHAWPGGPRERYRYCDLPTASVDATAMLLDFLSRQPLRPAAHAGRASPAKPAPKAKKARQPG